jgi:hypothetical protein
VTATAKNPETLPGLANTFKEVGVRTLPMLSKPVVFVGTAAGANQPIVIEGARAVKSLWVSYCKNNAGDFPSDTRERAYEAQMMAAYPVHPRTVPAVTDGLGRAREISEDARRAQDDGAKSFTGSGATVMAHQ